MSIIRRGAPLDRNFYILDKSISEDSRLSFEARGLLIFLLGKPDNWQVSIQHLVGESPAGKDKVARMLQELRQAGYVRCERQRGEAGKLAGYVYTVFETPHFSESPEPENQDMAELSPEPDLPYPEKPAPVKPFPANPPLISIEYKQELNTANQQQQRATVFGNVTAEPYQPKPETVFSEHWQPEETTVRRIAMLSIPEDFIRGCVPEFIAYWLTAGKAPFRGNYETAFLKSVRNTWTKHQNQQNQRGGNHAGKFSYPGNSGSEFIAALQSTDWANDYGKTPFDDDFTDPTDGTGQAHGELVDDGNYHDFPEVAGAVRNSGGSGWSAPGVAHNAGGAGRDK